MKSLQKYLTAILLFSMFNVFGQVQQDGSITIRKLCENCYDGEDNDGDGIIDCLDPDCEDELFNNLKSDITKSITNCLSCMGTHRDIIYEYEIKTLESGELLCETLIEIEIHEENIEMIAGDKDCPSGNDIFDENGNWLRNDGSGESGILVETSDGLTEYRLALISHLAHEMIAQHYLMNHFNEFPEIQNVNVVATSGSASFYMAIGSVDVENLPHGGTYGTSCYHNIGLQIQVTGSREIPKVHINGTYYSDKCKYLSTMRHELNHLYGEFPGQSGDQCSTSGLDRSLNHIIIYFNDYNSNMWQAATDDEFGGAFTDDLMYQPLSYNFLAFVASQIEKGNNSDSEYIKFVYCTYVNPIISDEWKDFISNFLNVNYFCD